MKSVTSRFTTLLLAFALTLVLGTAWIASDWSNLSHLWLPDTDDAMRLQQVRDWIAGQPLTDVSQQRLSGGLAMHWSRLGDIVPALLILVSRPLIGTTAAELTAVTVWPLLQFFAFLVLICSIAARISSSSATTALVLASLAYPASSLFLPGRIDHHGLQLLLVLAQVRALLADNNAKSGAAAGGAVALGAAIGLETLPFAIVTGLVIVCERLRNGGRRQLGFGIAVTSGLILLLPLSGHGGRCDTIAPLMLPAVASGITLAALGYVDHRRYRLFGTVVSALAILAWPSASACLSGPYGSMDPVVARMWLAQVGEARPLLGSSPAMAVSYAGLAITGLLSTAVLVHRDGSIWWHLLAYQVTSLALTMFQLRGVYVGTALAVVPIAALLVKQRERNHVGAVLALWIVGAGLLYPILAKITTLKRPPTSAVECGESALTRRLARLPAGRVLAGIDLGPYIIAGTRHNVIAAPYHRNDVGNREMLRFFLGSPADAKRIAAAWSIDYVVVCRSALGNVIAAPDTIAGGVRPVWLRPIWTNIYRVSR